MCRCKTGGIISRGISGCTALPHALQQIPETAVSEIHHQNAAKLTQKAIG
jgi:hypothetical protein